MHKVYVVTQGEYSSYEISAICSTREKAEYVKKYLKDANDIQEWDLDDFESGPQDTKPYAVSMRKNGDVTYTRITTPLNNNTDNRFYLDNWSEIDKDNGIYNPNVVFSFRVWAKSEVQAIKAANEKRAIMIASNLWDMKLRKMLIKLCGKNNHRIQEMFDYASR